MVDIKTDPTPPKLADLSSSRRIIPNRDAKRETFSLAPVIDAGIELDDYSDYTDRFLNPYTQNINAIRGEGQGALEQFRNFFGQVILGEVLGGTIEVAGYIAELLDFDSTIYGGQNGFTNALVEAGKSLKEFSRETMPIYEEREGEVNMLDTGWWLKNGVSIATMIPLIGVSGAANKGLSLVVKALAKGTRLSKTGSKALDAMKGTEFFKRAGEWAEKSGGAVSQAFISRHMESAMEASEIFSSIYEDYINRGFTEDQAKEFAAMGASSVYKRNYAMMLQDIPQYILLRGLSGVDKAGKTIAKTKRDVAGAIFKDMLGEGFEEAYQYVVSEEGNYVADVAAGLVEPTRFHDRIGNYVNGEMFTSAFFGALGGGLVQGLGAAYGARKRRKANEELDLEEGEYKDIPDKPDITPKDITKDAIIGELYFDALSNMTPETPGYRNIIKTHAAEQAFKAIRNDQVDSTRNFLEEVSKATPEELNALFPERDFSEANPELLTDVTSAFDIAIEEYKKAQKYGEYAEPIARVNTKRAIFQQSADAHKSEADLRRLDIPNVEELTNIGSRILEGRYQKKAAKRAIEAFNKIKKNEDVSPEAAAFAEEAISNLNDYIKRADKKLKTYEAKERQADDKANDDQIITNIDNHIDDIAEEYSKYLEDLEYVNYTKKKSSNLIKQAQGKSSPKKDFKKPESKKIKEQEGKEQEGKEKESENKKVDANIFKDIISNSSALEEDFGNVKPSVDGKKAEPGDLVRRNLTGDKTYRFARTSDGDPFIFDPKDTSKREFLSEAQVETLIVVTTPTKKKQDKTEKESKDELDERDSYYHPEEKDKDAEEKVKQKASVQSATWKSARNLERNENDAPDQENIDITNYLENGQPFEEGTYAEATIDERFIPEGFDINNLSEEQVLHAPIALDLTNSFGEPIYSGDTRVRVHVRTGRFIKNENDRKILLRQRNIILQGLARGEKVIVPVTGKGSGSITWDSQRRTNVKELLNQEDVILSVLTDNLQYKSGTVVPPEFEEVGEGNVSQIGRVYAATRAANGRQFPLPLERQKINEQEADLIYDLIGFLIGNGDVNSVLDGPIKQKALSIDRVSPLLEISPEITYIGLYNALIYETSKEETANPHTKRKFRLDFDSKTLVISTNTKDSQSYEYAQVMKNGSEIKKMLQSHYRNVEKRRLINPDYRNYLLDNKILYASVVPDQLFVNPVVYLGDAYIKRADVEEILVNKSAKYTPEPEGQSEQEKRFRELLEKNKDNKPLFQKRELSKTHAGKFISLLDNLKIRTGWDYDVINDPEIKWAGKVEGNKIFFNLAYASENTAFHEYAHPIIRQIKKENPRLYNNLVSQIMSDDQGRIVYSSVKANNPDYNSDQLVEETIVQLIGDLASNNIKTSYLANLIRRIWNMVLSYFNKLFPTVSISNLSLDTKLVDIANLLRSNNTIDINTSPMFGYQSLGMGQKEFDAWTNTLLNSVLRANEIYDISDVDKIDFSVLEPILIKIGANAKTEAQRESAMRVYFNIVNDDKSINKDSEFIKEINRKLRTHGIVESEEVGEEDVHRIRNAKPHYEINGKEKVTSDIKFVLSFIPKLNSNATRTDSQKVRDSIFERDYKLNEITNLPEYHTFADIWNTLTRELSDIVEIQQEDGSYEDIFDVFVQKIEEIAVERPEFNIVLERLMNKVSRDISTKSRFVRAFYVSSQNYLTVQANRGNKWNIIEKNPQGPEEQLIKRWTSNAVQIFTKTATTKSGKKVTIVDNDKVKNAENAYKIFADTLSADYTTNLNSETIKAANDALKSIGIDLEPRELDYYLRKAKGSKKASANHLRGQIYYYIYEKGGLKEMLPKQEGVKGIRTITDETKWFTETNSSVRELAEIKGFFDADLSDNNVLGPDGKPAYNYSSYSIMGKRLAEWRRDKSYLEKLRTYPFYANSLWNDHIRSGKELKLHNFHNLKTFLDKGNKLRDVNLGDRIASYIQLTLNGYFPLHARGSNSTEFVISGFDPITAYKNVGGNIKASKEAIDILIKYIYDEHNRIKTERRYVEAELKKKEEDDSYIPKMIDLYHTAKKGEIPSAFKLNLFSELQDPNSRFFSESLFKKENLEPVNIDLSQMLSDTRLRELVEQRLEKEVVRSMQYLNGENFFNLEKGENYGFDRETLRDKYIANAPTNIGNNAKFRFGVKALIYDYVFNSIVANKEQQKIFSGDPALYGDQSNLQKRIISSGSMGYSSYIDSYTEENYISAVIEDVEIASAYNEFFKEFDIVGYGDEQINVADAQAWVTPEFFFNLIKSYGKWKPEYDSFERMILSDEASISDIKDFMRQVMESDFSGQPLKTVHSELHIPEDGSPRFIYDKQTILPLFPSLVEGTNLENLLEAMVNNGIDHVSVISGTKLGATNPTKVTDDSGNFLPASQMKFNTFTQSRRYTLLQQDLPKKGYGKLLESSQAKWNILVDLKEGEEYFDGETKYDRDSFIDEFHKTQRAIALYERENLLKKLTRDGTVKTYDKNKGNALIKNEMTKRSLNNVLEEGLTAGYPPEALVGHNIPIQNQAASIINKNLVKLKHTNGIAAIQVSPLGFAKKFDDLSEEQKKGITFLTPEKDLKPPILKDGKLTGGGVFLPSSVLASYPDAMRNPEKLKKSLQGIDFRIPNQALSNIGFIEVVGILPPEMGDTAVVYGEITVKTGSDFDVDKIQIMMYNLHPNAPEKIKYWAGEATEKYLSEVYDDRASYNDLPGIKKGDLTERFGELVEATKDVPMSKSDFIKKYLGKSPHEFNSKLALENHKLDLYKAVMSNPDGYKRMMSALEGKEIENAINKTLEKYPEIKIGFGSDLDPTNGLFQAFMRETFLDANSAVGAVANSISDHAKSQGADIYVTEGEEQINLGIGNIKDINGIPTSVLSDIDEKITRYLSLMMNAQVDAEKDPYVAKGNINLNTISSVLTMIRFGIPLQFITDMVGHPIVREYIKVKRSFNNSFSYSPKTDIEQTLENFNKRRGTNFTVDDYSEIKYTSDPKDPLEFLRFYTRIEKISTKVSNGIAGSKFTVNGVGKNIFEMISLINAKEHSQLGNFHRKFFTKSGVETMEQTFGEAIDIFQDTFGKSFIASKRAFFNLVDEFAERQKISNTNTSAIEAIYRGLYSYIVSKTMNAPIDSLIGKENSVAKELAQVKEKKDLGLLNLMQPVFKNTADFIAFPNSLRFSEEEVNLFYDDWKQLHRDPETRDFSMRLAQYAFASSGFNYNINSFFQFMPIEVMDDFNIKETIEEAILEAGHENAFSEAFDQIVRNNYNNADIVPRISNRDVKRIKDGRIVLESKKKKLEEAPEYVFLKTRGTIFKPATEKLYRLVDSDKRIYEQSPTLGYSQDGFKIVEYANNQYIAESYFDKTKEPKVATSTQAKSKKTIVNSNPIQYVDNPERAIAIEQLASIPSTEAPTVKHGAVKMYFDFIGKSEVIDKAIKATDYNNLLEFIEAHSDMNAMQLSNEIQKIFNNC